jgi:hypothetical protein
MWAKQVALTDAALNTVAKGGLVAEMNSFENITR